MHYGIELNKAEKINKFWIVNDDWDLVYSCRAYNSDGDYCKYLYNFAKRNKLSESEFRNKMYLSSIEGAKKSFYLDIELERQKKSGKVFLSDAEIDLLINDVLRKENG